jgi:hypothetical protein
MSKFKDLNKLVKEFNNKIIKFKVTKHKGKNLKYLDRSKEYYEFKYDMEEEQDNDR